MDAIEKFVKGKDGMSYKKEYNALTGCVKASILLQQIAYIWLSNKRQPFYKFRAPCKHDAYKVGDSWVEIMGFTPRELDGAIEKLITIKAIFCKTNAARMTMHTLNEVVLNDYLEGVCINANQQKRNYLIDKSAITKSTKAQLDNQQNVDWVINKSAITLDSTDIDTDIDTDIIEEEENFANFLPPLFEKEEEDFLRLKAENESLKAKIEEAGKVARSMLEHANIELVEKAELLKSFDHRKDIGKVAPKKEKGKKIVLPKIIEQIPSDYEETWKMWIQHRYDQHKFEYKSAATEKLAFDELYGATLSNKDSELALKIVYQSMIAGWKALIALKDKSNHNQNNTNYAKSKPTVADKSDAMRDIIQYAANADFSRYASEY